MRRPHACLTVILGVAVLVSCLAPLSAQAQSSGRPAPFNYLDEITLPPDQQHPATRSVIAQLVASKIRTAQDAKTAVMRLREGSLSADELDQVTGLFAVEGTSLIGGSQRLPELVWEVTFMVGGAYIRSVYWVSSKTGAVMQLVPRR